MKKKSNCAVLGMMVSLGAVLLLTTPAWFSGMAFAALAAVVLWAALWKFRFWEPVLTGLASQPGVVAGGLVVASAYGCNFYNTWSDSRYVQKIAQLLGLDGGCLLTVCTVAMVLLSVPAVSCVLALLIREGREALAETRTLPQDTGKHSLQAGKALWILFLVLVVGFSAVLRTNFYYLDDNGRAAFGYKDWDYFGRYLSTAFSTLLHMGNYLTDIAPLPQLAALLLMAAAGIVLLYVFYGRTHFSLWELAAVVPLALNPYFLECLSFRFDAPYMAVSVLAGILPLVYRQRRTGVYLLASALGILAVCTSYQAATGIFPIAVIALALRMWNSGKTMKETAVFCLKSAAGYLLGLVYFKLVIMKPADAVYVSNSLPAAAELIPNLVENFKTYYGLILTDLKPFWHGLIGLTAVVYLVLSTAGSRQKKGAALILAALSLVLMLLLCFGIYPVLESTLFSPRAMYGFGVLLTILCVVGAEGWGKIPAKLPALALSWVFFVFSLTYGNALSLQKDYTEFRIQMVMEDLNDMEVFQSEETVVLRLSGGIGVTPILGHMPQDYNILNRLVPESFAGGDDLSTYRFFGYYGLQRSVTVGSPEECPRDMPVVKDGIFHTIRGEGNRLLVELKK